MSVGNGSLDVTPTAQAIKLKKKKKQKQKTLLFLAETALPPGLCDLGKGARLRSPKLSCHFMLLVLCDSVGIGRTHTCPSPFKAVSRKVASDPPLPHRLVFLFSSPCSGISELQASSVPS